MPIAPVQSDGLAAAASAGSIALAFPSNVVAGALLIVATAWETVDTTVTVTDTLGSTWLEAFHALAIADSKWNTVHYAIANGSGANTVTSTFGAAQTNRRILIHEFSGAATVSVFTRAAGEQGFDSTPSAGPVHPVSEGELLFGTITAVSVTVAPANGYTELEDVGDTQSQYKLQTAPLSDTTDWTLSAGTNSNCIVACFRAPVPTFEPPVLGVLAPSAGLFRTRHRGY